MPRETILREVGLAVATMPDGTKALAFIEKSGDVTLVPMGEEHFRTLAAQWNGLVIAGASSIPEMAPSIKSRNGGR